MKALNPINKSSLQYFKSTTASLLFILTALTISPNINAQTNLASLTILSKKNACHIALANHPTLTEAVHRMKRAKAGIKRTQSRYWPTISISTGATRTDPADSNSFGYDSHNTGAGVSYPATTGSTSSFSTDPEIWYQAGAQVTWMLFDGFARRASIAATKYGATEAEAGLKEAQRQILYSVISAYLNAQSAREQMRIAEEDGKFNKQLLQDAIANQKAGTGSLSDVLNFRIRANVARSTVIFAKRQLHIARIGLAILMGIENGMLPDTLKLAPLEQPTDSEEVIPSITNMLRISTNSRPDIQQAEAAIKRSTAALKIAKSEYYPKISLSGSYDAHRSDNISFVTDDFSSSAGIVISYDIFAGGLHRAQTAEAREALYEQDARFNSVKLQISQDVQNAIEQIRAAIEYLNLQNENVKYAQQNRDLIKQAYTAGQNSLVRMNEAQKDLIATQVRQTQAIISLRHARNNLASATGTILKLAE